MRGEKLVIFPLEAEPAFMQQHDGVAQAQVAGGVRHQHDGLLEIVREVLEPDHELVLGVGIEAAGQLVEEEERGVADQFLGQRDAAHLATGERAVFLVQERADAREVNDVLHPLIACGPRDGRGQAQRHSVSEDFRHGEIAVKRAELRQVADGEGKLVAQRLDRIAGEQDAARRDRRDAGERLEQRALAAAGRADDGDERALRHGEGNIAQERLMVVAPCRP